MIPFAPVKYFFSEIFGFLNAPIHNLDFADLVIQVKCSILV